MFFKKLSVDVEIDDLPAPVGGTNGSNFKISNRKVRLVTYVRKGLFKTKILIKVASTYDDY